MTEQHLSGQVDTQSVSETELNKLEEYYNHFVSLNGTEHLHSRAVKMVIEKLRNGASVGESFDKANSFADQVLADRAQRNP
jgi:hypothetical protein